MTKVKDTYRGWTVAYAYGYYSATGPDYEPSGVNDDGSLYNTADDQHIDGCRTIADLQAEIDAWIDEHGPATATNEPLMTEIKPEQRHYDAATRIRGFDIGELARHFAKFEAERLSTPADAGLREAVEPWSDYHGALPNYDHPLRCVYESGIQYAVEVLAKTLGVNEYSICDGTEEFDGDLGGTMMNIVLEALPKDEHGDPIYPEQVREMFAALQSSPSLDGGQEKS